MIRRDQCEDAKKKLMEIKNRLIQLGLFVELDPLYNKLNKMNNNLENAKVSAASTGVSSYDDDTTYGGVSSANYSFEIARTDFDEAREETLTSLKSRINELLSDIESDIRNHL